FRLSVFGVWRHDFQGWFWHRNQCSVSITFGKELKIRKVAMVIYWTKARSRAAKSPGGDRGQVKTRIILGRTLGRLSDFARGRTIECSALPLRGLPCGPSSRLTKPPLARDKNAARRSV